MNGGGTVWGRGEEIGRGLQEARQLGRGRGESRWGTERGRGEWGSNSWVGSTIMVGKYFQNQPITFNHLTLKHFSRMQSKPIIKQFRLHLLKIIASNVGEGGRVVSI